MLNNTECGDGISQYKWENAHIPNFLKFSVSLFLRHGMSHVLMKLLVKLLVRNNSKTHYYLDRCIHKLTLVNHRLVGYMANFQKLCKSTNINSWALRVSTIHVYSGWMQDRKTDKFSQKQRVLLMKGLATYFLNILEQGIIRSCNPEMKKAFRIFQHLSRSYFHYYSRTIFRPRAQNVSSFCIRHVLTHNLATWLTKVGSTLTTT